MLQVRLGSYINNIGIAADLQEEIQSISNDTNEIDYTGLDAYSKTAVKDIINYTRLLLAINMTQKIDDDTALQDYITLIREHLKQVGLISWIACRCAINMLSMVVDQSRIVSSSRAKLYNMIYSLVPDIRPFYEETPNNQSAKSIVKHLGPAFIQKMFEFSYPMPSHRVMFPLPLPRYIKLRRGNQYMSLVDLLVNKLHRKIKLPFEWINSLLIPQEYIRDIVGKRDCPLPETLTFIGECHFAYVGSTPMLRVQDTQRILKVARNTDQPKILAGVAVTLQQANFLRMAEPELISKILRSAPNDILAIRLFEEGMLPGEKHDSESFSKEINTISQVANDVIHNPDKYSFQTVCLAAKYIVKHKYIDFKPLIHIEDTIGRSSDTTPYLCR